MEYFDIVDELGNPTGQTVARTEAHKTGARHRTAHVWVIDQNRGKTKILLQKRAMTKDSFPGRFDTSSAGHIKAGDEPKESAVRELGEELGIKAAANELTLIGKFINRYETEFSGRFFSDNEITFVYVYAKKPDIAALVLQTEEVESVEWFDFDEVYHETLRHNKKFCVPIAGLEVLKNYINHNE